MRCQTFWKSTMERLPSGVVWTLLLSILFGQSAAQGDFGPPDPFDLDLGSTPLDIVFVVDTSGFSNSTESLNQEEAVKGFLTGFLENADINSGNVKVAMVTYSTHPKVIFDLNKYSTKTDMEDAVFLADFEKEEPKERNLADALSLVRTKILVRDRREAPNVVLLLMSGKSDRNSVRTLQEADGLKFARAKIFGIGISLDDDDAEEMFEVSSKPTMENTFLISSVYELEMLRELVLMQIFARAEQAFKAPAAGSETLDLAFLLHYSNSVSREDFQRILDFMKNILQYSDIDDDKLRVGAVVFRKRGIPLFDFNNYYSQEEVFGGIDQISYNYRSKRSSIASGFYTVRTSLFTRTGGARDLAPDLVILITDSNADTDVDQTITAVERMKAEGAAVYVVGINVTYPEELLSIASNPRYNVMVNDAAELEGHDEQFHNDFVALRAKSFSVVIPALESSTASGTSAASTFYVPLSASTFYVPLSASTFYVPLSVSEEADIVLLVHLSPRITEMEFITVQEFLKSLVSRADIANGKAQIGLVFYGSDPEIIFHINQYNTIALMQKSIDGMRTDLRSYTSDASTAIASAKQMLSPYFNRRDDVPAAMIFIADDPANINFDVMKDERDRAIEDGIRILTVGIGVSDKSKLESLASESDFIMNYDNVWMLNAAENDITEKIFAFQSDGVTEDKLIEETTIAPTTTPPADTTVFEEIITKSDGIVLELPSGLVDPNKCSLGNSDLVIILDASTSVTQQNYDKMLQFTKDLLQNADIDSGAVRVGILIFSTEVQVMFNLNEYSRKADVFAAIDKIPYIFGSTNTANALQTMHTQMFTPRNGDRPNVPNTGIVITDGVSNINSRRTISEADAARTAGIHVYAIGIGLTDTRELDGIANTPKTDNSFNVQNFDELVGLDRKIFSALCPEKAVTVPVTTPKPKPSCGVSSVDVVIIIDASTSVTEANFKLMLEFCKDIVKGADIDSGSVRVGVLIYSTEVEIQFHLNRYSTNAQVIDAIDKIPYIYGSTNTADALLTMHQTMFTSANGDRQGVTNVAIVLTDGVSNINSRRTIKEAVTARSKDINVYVIGISLTDTREVEGMASEPKDKYLYNVRRFEELQGLEEDIFGAGEGGDCGPKPTTPAPTTLAPKTECGLSKVDAVIILDASTSVTEPNFKKMLNFCKEIVDKAAIDSGSVRIGVLIYSTEVEIEFHLNNYTNTADIKAAIDRIPYMYGTTNTADALKTMHELMFSARNGDRPDVDNIAFLITDGISNINGRRTIPEAEKAQGKAIRVYAIGIDLTDTRELEGIASEPKSGNMFNVKAFDELTGLIDTIFGGAEECAFSEPPIAVAGPDVTRRYPSGTITLDGRRSSDDNKIVTYTWSRDGRDLFTGATFDLNDLREGEYEYNLTVVDEDRQSDSDTVRVVIEAQDFPPNANAGDDVTIQLPVNSVRLDGRQSSDDVAVVQYMWKLTIGPPGVSLDGDDSATLVVDDLEEGEYTLTLTVTDALGQTDDDTVNVYVKAQDFPPTANAGVDVTIQLPVDYVILDGRNSSDDITIVQYMWKLTNGQPGVSLEGDDSARLMVEDLEEGEYTFTLTVTDVLGQTDDDTVNVYVKAANQPPRADAGQDVEIQLPVNQVTLDGSRSTDDVSIARYRWRIREGDENAVVMHGDRSAVLQLSNLTEGTYRFSLTVSDDEGERDTDYVNVVVKPGS